MTYPVCTVENTVIRYTALYQFSGVHVCKITMQTIKTISIIRQKPKHLQKSISNSAQELSGYWGVGGGGGLLCFRVFFPLSVSGKVSSEQGHS